EKVKRLREYGWKTRYQSEQFGTNSRLDEIQAALLKIKLRKLDEWNAKRRQNAAILLNTLKGNPNIVLPNIQENTLPVFHQFVIQTNNRDNFIKKLAEKNIQCGIHYPWPNHLQKGYNPPESVRVPLQNTEKACQKIVSLPVHQHLSETDVDKIINAAINL
ncbi:MAG: DegT/DnrJ/EryC1/StrS aminotransferase, partial [uncultured bacterium]